MSAVRTLRGPMGATLTLDPMQVIPDDPGQGTPAVVSWGDYSGTFWCCLDTGEIDGFDLPDAVHRWLASLDAEVCDWLDAETEAAS